MNRRIAVLGGWLLAALAALAVVLRAPPPNADITQFLPDGVRPEQRLLLAELRDSPVGRLVLAEIDGAAPAAIAETSRSFAARARALPGVAAVLNGQLDALPPATAELLFRYRYLLTDSGEPLTEAGLTRALDNRLRELAAPVPFPDRDRLPADPVAAYRTLLLGMAGSGGPQRLHGVWFNRRGDKALLLLYTAVPAFDLDAQEQVLAGLNRAFADLPGSAGQRLDLVGPAVFAVESRDRMRSQTERLTIAASVGIALLIALLFRSFGVVLAAALPAALSILLGVAAVEAAFGAIHGITLAFGVTLLGEAVDYPTYLFSHARGRSLGEAARAIWPTLLVAALTSIVGFFALLFSGFSGLAQLGLFSMVGIAVAALATRSLLPALLPRFTTPPAADLGVARLAGRLAGHAWLPLLLSLAAGAWLLWQGPDLWERDLAALSPLPEQRKADDEHLRAELGAPDTRHLLVVTAADAEEALQRCERLQPLLEQLIAEGRLQGYESPAKVLPSAARQWARQSALPDEPALRAALAAAAANRPFRSGLFEPFLRDVAASRELTPLTPAALAGTPLEVRVGSLLRHRDGGWVALLPLVGVHGGLAGAVPAEGWLHFMDLAGESSRLVDEYRGETLRLVLLGAAGNLLLLLVRFRRIGRVLRIGLPPFGAVLVTAAVLTAGGAHLTLFHLAALLLVFGVGIDYALFFDRLGAAGRDRDATTSALVICNATALLGFGVLGFADAPVLHSIGVTLALGTPLGLMFAALLAHNSAALPGGGATQS